LLLISTNLHGTIRYQSYIELKSCVSPA